MSKRVNIGVWWGSRARRREPAGFFRQIRATTCETYVKWIDIEPEPGDIRFDQFDRTLAEIRKLGLKWQPFLICGPWYATPYWFRDSGDSHFFRCLEHKRNSGIQSIWNRSFRKQIRRFLKLFHDHYKNDMYSIDSLLLGVSGDYGEAIYPVIGNFNGQYHTHRGFWCGDELAILDFRRHVKRKYGTIRKLNASWKASYSSFSQVAPFLKKDAPSRRAMLDMVDWYRQAMLDHSEFWIREARKLWPRKDVYLCMGGDGSAEEGQYYSAAAKMCAKYNVGVRDTNAREGLNLLNAYQCDTAVATNFYGTYCGFESSNGSDKKEIVARMFSFVLSSAREFHEYSLHGRKEVVRSFRKYREFLETSFHRKVDVAVLSSKAYVNWFHEHAGSWKIKAFPWGLPKPAHDLFSRLRYHFDFDIVDDCLIRDGILAKYRALIVPGFSILEDDITEAVKKRAGKGLAVLVYGKDDPETVDGQKIGFENAETAGSLKTLLALLSKMKIRVRSTKDGVFEVVDTRGNVICYDENKNRIYRSRA
jgi:hypothetical protein